MGEKSVTVTEMICIYREVSPMAKCTYFNANLVVTVASF